MYCILRCLIGPCALCLQRQLKAIAKALAAFPQYTVLWKLGIPDKCLSRNQSLAVPENTHLVEFAPQNDVLGHENTRLFITHGGLNLLHEVCVFHILAFQRMMYLCLALLCKAC